MAKAKQAKDDLAGKSAAEVYAAHHATDHPAVGKVTSTGDVAVTPGDSCKCPKCVEHRATL